MITRLITLIIAIGYGLNVYAKYKEFVEREQKRIKRNLHYATMRASSDNPYYDTADLPAPALKDVLGELLSLRGPRGYEGPVGMQGEQGIQGEPGMGCTHMPLGGPVKSGY